MQPFEMFTTHNLVNGSKNKYINNIVRLKAHMNNAINGCLDLVRACSFYLYAFLFVHNCTVDKIIKGGPLQNKSLLFSQNVFSAFS